MFVYRRPPHRMRARPWIPWIPTAPTSTFVPRIMVYVSAISTLALAVVGCLL